MSTVKANTIAPDDSTQDITLGASGDTVSIPGNDLRVNTVKDKGGNTLWTSDGTGTLSSVNAGLKGNLVLLNTSDFSGETEIGFGSTLITSTYEVYVFKFINVQCPATGSTVFHFNVSADNGTTYNIEKTTTAYSAYHEIGGGQSVTLGYLTSYDLAQSTNYQPLAWGLGDDAWQSMSGEMWLFAPSSTTYVKNFYARTTQTYYEPYIMDNYWAGYGNTTSAINQVNFKAASGNINGTIKLYGLI